jgi:hypothetical protein
MLGTLAIPLNARFLGLAREALAIAILLTQQRGANLAICLESSVILECMRRCLVSAYSHFFRLKMMSWMTAIRIITPTAPT